MIIFFFLNHHFGRLLFIVLAVIWFYLVDHGGPCISSCECLHMFCQVYYIVKRGKLVYPRFSCWPLGDISTMVFAISNDFFSF